MNKQDKQKLQKKYDNLSLVERNAYEQIIDRHDEKTHWMFFPFEVIRMLTIFGVFIISISIISGVDVSVFSEGYMSAAAVLLLITIPLMILGIIFNIINYFRLNKLKRKLLSE